VQQERRDDISFFRFESLPNRRLHHAVFTRQGGVSPAPFATLNLSVSVADERANVLANRTRAYGTHGRATNTLVHAHLVHGAEVTRVTAGHYGQNVGPADGIIADQPGCGLAMNFADCAPILLYDPIRRAIGLGHAGWQGAVKDLPGAMVRAMVEAFGSRPADLLGGVGPCIGPCCYEVGEPVTSAVNAAFPGDNSLLAPGLGPRPHFDLPAANRRCLERAGVRQVELAGLCTACRTDLFFSHRAEKGRTGRFGTILILD
jgi:YfiH family protein